MEKKDLEDAKYIAWVNHGYEGWNPNPYKTLKEAVLHDSYGGEKIITSSLIELDIREATLNR